MFDSRQKKDSRHMNLLVLSDSHGRTSRILEAIDRQVRRPDAIIFLGDGLRDMAYCELNGIPLYAVCGNCDFHTVYGGVCGEEEILITLGDKRILMTHGHEYGVKSSLARLVASAVRRDVDLVLFGHTHIPLERCIPEGMNEFGIEQKKPLYLLNPGSVGGYDGSFGSVEIDKGGNILLSHGEI